MICLSDSDYVKVVNGLIRLQELDTLYKLCQLKLANADSQIINYQVVIANNDSIVSRYERLTDSLKLELYLERQKGVTRKRLLIGVGAGGVLGWLVAIF